MNDDERQLWTEQILQWMLSTDTSPEIRFACGQALAGINCTYFAAMQGGHQQIITITICCTRLHSRNVPASWYITAGDLLHMHAECLDSLTRGICWTTCMHFLMPNATR